MESSIKSEISAVKSEIREHLRELIKDNISWVAYQEKDKNSTFSDYDAYGSGYEDSEDESFMPLLAAIYRDLKYKLFDEVLYEKNSINKPCCIIKEYGIEDNSINKTPDNSLIVKYYGDSKTTIANFWDNIKNKRPFKIVADIKSIIETTLNCEINISKEISDILSPNESDHRLKASKDILDIINATISSDIKINQSSLYSNAESNKDKILLIGSLLFPWEMLVYDDFSICFGRNQIIEGGITISYREQEKDETKRIINLNKLKLISVRKIWEDNILYRKILSIRTAKAAIMSRNMSHNLGSHVMAYLKQNLSSVKDLLNDRVLSIMFDCESDLVKKLEALNSIKNTEAYDEWSNLLKKIESQNSDITNCDNVALPFLVGLGQFISYLQERQDFIATIATDFIPYYATVNFKDFIYDELNPDKRYERHPDRTNLQIDNILLGNIARSEGLGRPTSPTRKMQPSNNFGDIIIKFRNFDGNPVEGGNINTESEEIKKKAISLNEMRRIDVSLPGGLVGRQAIFSIVENVIRNAAKHGDWQNVKNLELTFNIFTKEDLIKVNTLTIDNTEEDNFLYDALAKEYRDALDCDDLYIVTLTDNLVCVPNTLEKLHKAIEEKYIDDNGNMKETNKGIKEMKISASWLRSIKDEDVAKAKGCAPILRARISNGHLQYIFCLMRPKKVAIISSKFEGGRNYKKDNLVEISWSALTPEKFEEQTNKSYEFILLDDNAEYKDSCQDVISTEEMYRKMRRISSSRLYRLSEVCGKGKFPSYDVLLTKIGNGLGTQEAENLLTELYRYIANCQDGDRIFVMDEKIKAPENESSIVLVNKHNDDIPMSPYVYLSHYETEENFQSILNELSESGRYWSNLFIEGITGNNSTDRLVRKETLNELWSYKHLHAMKEKIAIFDERIFSKVYGLEENDFTDNNIQRIKNNYLKYFTRNKNDENFRNYFEAICQVVANCESIDDLQKSDVLKDIPNDELIEPKDLICPNYTGTTLVQKGIYVYTFIRSKDSNTFKLCGLCWDENTAKGIVSTLRRERNKYYSKCEVLAIVRWDKNEKKLLIELDDAKTPKKRYSGLFDKISIHQGLLDKLYECFDIKDNQSDKEALTKGLYKIFSKNNGAGSFEIGNDKENIDTRGWYLPGMCIHSGRSKPSKFDMPQHLPFIQYSSIEHAVFDCKYSLVELLDFARYEKE